MFLGLILIVIGLVFLLKNLGYISEPAWSIIWPVILIVIGLGTLLKRDEGFYWKEWFGWKKKELPSNQPTSTKISRKKTSKGRNQPFGKVQG